MVTTYHFDRNQDIPVVAVKLFGKRDNKAARLVFDTGAATTQLNTPLIEDLGYSASDGIGLVSAFGPAGPIQSGYNLVLKGITLFGLEFKDVKVSVYDFDIPETYQIDGLIGFDLIKQMRLELDGPEGLLRVHSKTL